MRWEQKVEYAAKTDVGLRRRNNEDAWVVQLSADEGNWAERGHLFAVADGMGGHAVGELASKIAADTLPHTYFKKKEGDAIVALKGAIEAANANIHARGSQNRDFQRMGTTCTALVLTRSGAIVGHVGDSRIYRVRRDRIEQLTFDHSLAWELERRGQTALGAAGLQGNRNVITRSLGPEAEVQIDLEGPYAIQPYDSFVLCSDGLTGHVTDEEIAVITRELSPAGAARLLVHLANIRGGSDNCTVIVVRVADFPGNVQPLVDEPPEPQRPSLSWKSLLTFWLVGVLLVCGLTLILFQHPIPGITLAACAVLGGALAAIAAWQERQSHLAELQLRQPQRPSQPYRSAVARPIRELLDEFAEIASELRRTAQEDDWTVNWERHDRFLQTAQAAMAADRNSKALQEYGKVIDTLMAGMQLPQRVET